MMRVQRQQVQQEQEAFGNPWSKELSGNEEKPWPALVFRLPRSAECSSSRGNTKTRMTPRPPDTPPPRKSKGTQTENEKEKEEEEEHKEEERYNFVKRVDAMISSLKQKAWPLPPRSRPRPSGEARVLKTKNARVADPRTVQGPAPTPKAMTA